MRKNMWGCLLIGWLIAMVIPPQQVLGMFRRGGK